MITRSPRVDSRHGGPSPMPRGLGTATLALSNVDDPITRSQAKRLLQRVDRFKTVVLDFAGVASIGQAFADEVFRVFANTHPDVELVAMHATAQVQQMIRRAEVARDEGR